MKRLVSVILLICMALFLNGCAKTEAATLNIATKPMTEQYILGQMIKILVEENTDLEVNITKGVGGGTANIHAGLLSGDFDLYPEYTSTAWLHVLKKEDVPDNDTLFRELKKEYSEQYGLAWVGLYGFNNTFGLLVSEDFVEQYGLETYSDLAEHSDEMIFGAGYDFYEREDGFTALCDTYGIEFKEAVDMDLGLKYAAFGDKKVDVITVYTTDAQINIAKGSVLKDDKNFFVDYFCGTVVREEVLEKYPELEEVLMMLVGAISDEEMSAMNYALEVEQRDEAEIAREFLEAKGLIAAG